MANIFVQDKIEIVDDSLYFTLGSKFEHNDFTGWEIQPSARVLWLPSERQTVWASVASAVRTPNRGEAGIDSVVFGNEPAVGLLGKD